MAVKLRLRQQGRQHEPSYRIVATDGRTRRDGRYLESLGWYSPTQTQKDKVLYVNTPRVDYWLGVGATMSDKTRTLIKQVAPEIIKKELEKQLVKREKVRLQRKKRRARKSERAKA